MSENSVLHYVRQVSKGAGYPAATDMIEINAESHPLGYDDTYTDDGGKRTDRQGGSMYVSGFESSLPIRGQARYGAYDKLWEDLLSRTASYIATDCANGDCAYTATGNKLVLTAGTFAAGWVAGVPVQITKVDAGANPLEVIGLITERSVNSKELTIAGVTLANETPAGAVKLRIHWLPNGTSKHYSIIEELISAGNYNRGLDGVVQRGAYNAPATGSVKVEFDMVFRSASTVTTSIAADNSQAVTPADATQTPIVADTAVLALRLDNAELDAAIDVIDHNLTINGNVQPYDAQRHRGPADFHFDTFTVEHTLSVMWQNAESFIRDYKSAQRAGTTTASFMRVDSDRANNRFGWITPRCTRTKGTISTGARDNKTTVPLTFSAERHPDWNYKVGLFWFPQTPETA